MLAAVASHTAAHCAAALVMPNLAPPVTTRAIARAYQARIADAAPAEFQALLTVYLTDGIDADEVIAGFRAGDWIAAKLYPAHATTNSAHGVSDIQALVPVLAAMADAGMPLCVHGEVTDPHVDIFDREAVFLSTILGPLMTQLPTLRVIVEHATTAAAVEFVARRTDRAAMSITAHHLWWNRNAMFDGGLRPHAYCLPVLKRETDRQALVKAATSGAPNVFFGTDSAPHLVGRKETDCGCAGVFSAPTAVATVAEVFDDAGALAHLEAFLSLNGPTWYGREPSEQHITLDRKPTIAPAVLHTPEGPVRIFRGGETLRYVVTAD
ncbi:MAG: dihydroorotase [Myxococcota bacterium]|jgi:dihydroorotase